MHAEENVIQRVTYSLQCTKLVACTGGDRAYRSGVWGDGSVHGVVKGSAEAA